MPLCSQVFGQWDLGLVKPRKGLESYPISITKNLVKPAQICGHYILKAYKPMMEVIRNTQITWQPCCSRKVWWPDSQQFLRWKQWSFQPWCGFWTSKGTHFSYIKSGQTRTTVHTLPTVKRKPMLGVSREPSSHNHHAVLSKVSRPDSQQFLQLEMGGSFGPGMVFVPRVILFYFPPPKKEGQTRTILYIYTHTTMKAHRPIWVVSETLKVHIQPCHM